MLGKEATRRRNGEVIGKKGLGRKNREGIEGGKVEKNNEGENHVEGKGRNLLGKEGTR